MNQPTNQLTNQPKEQEMKITMERYGELSSSYEGFCTTCDKFTRGECEPDASEYECPVCGEKTVMGAEEALMQGKIGIEAD
jgi:predicted RNA-binding Zn-ribbon protein involved in translation (DUF1610 family)